MAGDLLTHNVFKDSVLALAEIQSARDACLHGKRSIISIGGITDSAKTLTAYAVFHDVPWKLYVCESDRIARERFEEYRSFDEAAAFFPAKDLLFYQSDLRSNELTRERVQAVEGLLSGSRIAVFTSAAALLNKLPPKESFRKGFMTLKEDSETDPESLIRFLVENGYENNPEVEGPGEFTSRGGIIDVFPLTAALPVRIEFFGDEIDSMRTFDPVSQKSIERIKSVSLSPAAETVHKAEYVGGESVSILSYVPEENSVVIFDEPSRIVSVIEDVTAEFHEAMERRLLVGEAESGDKELIFPEKELFEKINSVNAVTLSMLDYTTGRIKSSAHFYVHTTEIVSFRKDFSLFIKDLKKYRKNGLKTVVVSPSRTRAAKLADDIRSYDVNCYFSEDTDRDMVPGEILVTTGGLVNGTVFDGSGYVFITESDIFGTAVRKKRTKRRHFTGGEKVRSLRDLHVGDYVVHENYGLGIYQGLEQITADGIQKDYIKIAYDKGDNLYILATQFDMIGKYAGAGDRKPKLNSIGTKEWAETKARVKKAVGEIAEDLVELYAKRQNEKSFVYLEDGQMQREFEEGFPYEETESQIAAIEDVKHDMESNKIMDRLICGDVGYGKTEVALRAAFKAVTAGKQVVYLCPTTILCEQHYNTFRERMAPFAVNVEMMSRFRSSAENKKTVEALKNGTVDIVIATHRVLSQDVSFKNLGLLIIDEEQRFGVTHKERIKKLKTNVDVLSLSATPIPRTLHMSLVGIRDMSLLEEAPQERMPIQTYVCERTPEIVREAIEREIARGGQVYYVYNKVKDIADVTTRIAKLVPGAAVEYAHGQMAEGRLEEIMSDFINRRIDVLVSTTIIEIGLDISNVNTIIIHDSDRLGLSQLYQLRGRVGRSNRTAYAFLMYKKDRLIKETAEKRLSAIREFTELGSGFKIAMRDLEIRGAGNLLGEAQSGHMEAVGYDLYVKMLSEAVDEKRNGKREEEEAFETTVDVNIEAFIPDTYIPDASQKLEAYRRIAGLKNDADRSEETDELIDRYGDIPSAVNNLMDIALLKAAAHSAYITSIKQKDNEFTFALSPSGKLDAAGIPELVTKFSPYLSFNADPKAPSFTFDAGKNNRMSKAEIARVPAVITSAISDRLVLRKEETDADGGCGTG